MTAITSTDNPSGEFRRLLSPGLGWMLLSALAFSLMAAQVKVLARTLPTQEIVFARALVTLVITAVALRGRRIAVWGQRKGLLVLRGALGYVALSAGFWAIGRLPLAEATVIHYLHPVCSLILAGIVLKEGFSSRLVVAALLGFGGVVLTVAPSFGGHSTQALPPAAVVAALAGAVMSAGAYVTVRKLSASDHPLVIVFYFPFVAMPASLPAVLQYGRWPVGPEWWLLLGVGVTTQIGQLALTYALRVEKAGRATTFAYAQVPLAALWGAIFFQEVPGLALVGGALLVFCGVLMAALQPQDPTLALPPCGKGNQARSRRGIGKGCAAK